MVKQLLTIAAGVLIGLAIVRFLPAGAKQFFVA